MNINAKSSEKYHQNIAIYKIITLHEQMEFIILRPAWFTIQ